MGSSAVLISLICPVILAVWFLDRSRLQRSLEDTCSSLRDCLKRETDLNEELESNRSTNQRLRQSIRDISANLAKEKAKSAESNKNHQSTLKDLSRLKRSHAELENELNALRKRKVQETALRKQVEELDKERNEFSILRKRLEDRVSQIQTNLMQVISLNEQLSLQVLNQNQKIFQLEKANYEILGINSAQLVHAPRHQAQSLEEISSTRHVSPLNRMFTLYTILRVFSRDVDDEKDPENFCAICHEIYRQGETQRVITWCQHSFHQTCVDRWLQKSRSCPLCRLNLIV